MAKMKNSSPGDTALAQTAYDQSRANEASGFSAFGGHLLTRSSGVRSGVELAEEQNTTLASLGIQDSEQLIAIAAIPEVRDELAVVLGGEAVLQQLIDQANGTLPPE